MAYFKLLTSTLGFLSASSVITTVLLFHARNNVLTIHAPSHVALAHHVDKQRYSFIHDDFPNAPLFDVGNVLMHAEDSIHYRGHGEAATQEWNALDVIGLGSVTYGEDYRAFYLPMFHQIHCLLTFRSSILQGTDYKSQKEHMHHCFDYFRKWILCQADLTLEPGDFMTRNFTTQRIGPSVTHVCKNWDSVYRQTTLNWVEWSKYWAQSKV